VLQVISSSPGDLQPVFATMLEKAVRICDATFGDVYRPHGDAIQLVAMQNTPPAFAEALKQTPHFRPSSSVGVRMVATKSAVQVTDLAADQDYVERRSPFIVAAVELGGVRTVLAVPMLKENELIGAFLLCRQEVRPFTDKQIELVKNFAAQAVIAIENARLLNELRQRTDDLTEALEQRTATSEVLQVISTSPGELEPVFESLLQNATRVCHANFGNLALCEGDGFRNVAIHNAVPVVDEFFRGQLFHPHPDSPLSLAARHKRPSHIVDIRATTPYLVGNKGIVMLADVGGARTFLCVPMLKESEVAGVIILYRSEVRPFTDKQIELVQNFAAQAVIAIENARLLKELRQSLEQQTASADVLKVISSSPGAVEPVFKALLENATQLCGASYGNLWLCEGDAFRSVALHGPLPASYMKRWGPGAPLFHPEPGVPLAEAAKTRQPFQIPDIRESLIYLDQNLLAVSAVNEAAMLAVIAVPMIKEDQLVGAVAIYSKEARPFSEKQIELLENFASQAVIAIENARLLRELRERTDQLETQSQELAELNQQLEQRVTDQVGEIERMGRCGASCLRRWLI
jgi:GAF domain-containing protein